MSLPTEWTKTTLDDLAYINPIEKLPKNSISKKIAMEKLEPFIRKISSYDKEIFKGGVKFKNGDTLIARITPSLENGKTAYVDILDDDEIGFGSTEFIVLREKETISDKLFLYYFSISKTFRDVAIKSMTGTSGRQRVQIDTVKNTFFTFPPLLEQKAIATILSSFDEKIELLKVNNETLERMAQTIFNEWFVKFNYPHATGNMVNSEVGEIPEGWRVFTLNELVEIVNGYSYKGKELVESSDEALVTLKSFNRDGGFQTRGFKPFVGTPKGHQEVKVGDLVVAHTDLTQDADVLGNPAFIFEDGGYKKMYITMDLVKVITKKEQIDNAFLYYVMKDRRFKGHCIGYSNGTTVLHLSKSAIPEYEIALPEDLKLAKEFSDIAYSMTNKISNNINQIQILQKIRDTLLAKLMSGEVRVKGFGA